MQQGFQENNELMYVYQIYTRQECAQKLLEKEIVEQSNKNQNNANSERIKRQTQYCVLLGETNPQDLNNLVKNERMRSDGLNFEKYIGKIGFT